MAHRRLNRPETGLCIPYEKMNSFQKLCHEKKASGIMGLWLQDTIIKTCNKENEDKLIATGFLTPRSIPPHAKPAERRPYAEWEKKPPLLN